MNIFQNDNRLFLLIFLGVAFTLYLISSTQTIFSARRIQHAVEKEEVILINLGDNSKKSTNFSNLTVQLKNLNNSQIYQLAELESNLPLTFWERWKDFEVETKQRDGVTYCTEVLLTDPFYVQFNNRFWQLFRDEESSITMNLLNAYYDKRIVGSPVVKLLTVNNQESLSRTRDWWCLLWFENQKSPILVKANDYYTLWDIRYGPKLQKDIYYPQLISCPIPSEFQNEVPQAVSLQSKGSCSSVEAKPSNTLRVIYNQREISNEYSSNENKSRIGICVKAFRFSFYDISVRLVEWLEMMKLLGAERVHFYVYSSNDNLMKVLKNYHDENFVDWRQMALPGDQLNIPALYQLFADTMDYKNWPQELIELNDCLYQNMYRYDYIAVVDVDEVIMPQQVTNWHHLIEDIESRISNSNKNSIAYYSARHSHVCQVLEEQMYQNEPIPEYLYMSRHIFRAQPLQNVNQKSIIRTDLVTAMHNHFPLRCINPNIENKTSCNQFVIETTDGVMLHYRKNQTHPKWVFQNDACTIQDTSQWRFFRQMRTNVRAKLDQIFLIN